MTIQDLGAIGELIGAFAVLATLIYLSIQIKNSTKAQRAQTHQQMYSDRAATLRMIIESPDIRTAYAKSSVGEPLTESEHNLVLWMTALNVRAYENELFQHSMGMVDDRELEVMRTLLEMPHAKIEELAESAMHTFTPEVQKELSRIVEARKGAT